MINNLKQDIQRLKSQVVSNPEALKKVINEMNQSLKEEKQTLTISDRKAQQLQNKIDMLKMIENVKPFNFRMLVIARFCLMKL